MERVKSVRNSLMMAAINSILVVAALGADSLYFLPQIVIGTFALIGLALHGQRFGSTIFHPIPLVSIVLVWSLTLAPAVSVYVDHYVSWAPKEIEWSYWMPTISWLYTIGTLLFVVGARLGLRKSKLTLPHQIQFTTRAKIRRIAPVFLLLAGCMQIYVFSKFGGIVGYISTWTEDRTMFEGLGPLLLIAEAFPMLLLIALVLYFERDVVRRKFWVIAFAFVVFFMLKILFGGLRGSRSNTIWGLFWFAGIVHIYYFRLKAGHFVGGMLAIVGFMSIYTVYKSFGADAFSGEYAIEDTARFNDGPVESILLDDFSRAGVNAYIVNEYLAGSGYQMKYGLTYVDSALKLVPFFGSIPGTSKNVAGAELFYGLGANADIGAYKNSRIFGLYGEGVLNFGPIFGLFLFFIAGVIVAKLDNKCRSWNANDVRVLFIPFVSNGALMLVLADSDNLVFFLLKNGFLVGAFLYFVSASSRPRASLSFKRKVRA
jgi:hypothetical protein